MSEENLYTFENEAYRKTYWHTCSHVMAQAVKRLYPQVKLAIGRPSTAAGTTILMQTSASRRSTLTPSRPR